MDGWSLTPLAWAPAVDTLTRVVVSDRVLRTKTSDSLLVSPVTTLLAVVAKATNRPRPLRSDCTVLALAVLPVVATVMRPVTGSLWEVALAGEAGSTRVEREAS